MSPRTRGKVSKADLVAPGLWMASSLGVGREKGEGG